MLLQSLRSEWVSTAIVAVAASAGTYVAVKATKKYKEWRSTEDLKNALAKVAKASSK